MKKKILLIFISIMSLGCVINLKKSIEYYEGINMYNLKGINRVTTPFFRLKPYVSIQRIKDTILIKSYRVKCPTTEIYVKNKVNVWVSSIFKESHNVGKLYIPQYSEEKHVYNDTMIKYIHGGVTYKSLGYKPRYSVIIVETKQNKLKLYQPNFSTLPSSLLKKSEINKLKKNSIIIDEIDKFFVNDNYYEDIISNNYMKDSIYKTIYGKRNPIKKYTLFYKLDSVSEYFLERDKCDDFEKTELDYKKHYPRYR